MKRNTLTKLVYVEKYIYLKDVLRFIHLYEQEGVRGKIPLTRGKQKGLYITFAYLAM